MPCRGSEKSEIVFSLRPDRIDNRLKQTRLGVDTLPSLSLDKAAEKTAKKKRINVPSRQRSVEAVKHRQLKKRRVAAMRE